MRPYSVEYRPTSGYFGMLAAHNLLFGKGIGSLLLAHAEKTMRNEGLNESSCQVVSPIPRLQGYYERRGYRLTGESEPWISDNLKVEACFYTMKKELA